MSSAIRSHFRRSAASSRPALLSKHILLGSQSELALAPALHPESVLLERRPRGTIWYLSAQAGYWNPFERARVSHLIPKEGEGIKLGGAVTKRKREEAAAAAAAAAASTPVGGSTGGGGIKIRLKVSSAARDDDDDPLLLDGTMGAIGDELGEGTSSHSRSLGSSSSGTDPRLGPGRRQRGPRDGFPNFARLDSDSDSDDLDGPTPTSSLPNPRSSHLRHRPPFAPPRLHARQSMPNPALHPSPKGRPSSHARNGGAASDSSSSSEGEDFHEAMLRSDDFAFGMDDMDDGSGDDNGDTPATTPRDGAVDGLSDQQGQTAKPSASASPPPRRSTLPPVPTPAEVLAGGPVPISADPNGMDVTTEGSFSSSELSDPALVHRRLGTAPLSPVQPFNSSSVEHRYPHSAPAAGLLALPRMSAESPSPSPAVASIVLPHLHGLPSFIAHSSPSRHTFHAHLTSGVGSTPNSPSTETKEQEEAFNLTLALLPRDFKPISLRERLGPNRSCGTAALDQFDDEDSICVVHGEDASPRSDGSGLFDDFGDCGGREASLATSEDDHCHRNAERWAIESGPSLLRSMVKTEPSSPRMLLDEETDSPPSDASSFVRHPSTHPDRAEEDDGTRSSAKQAAPCETDSAEDASMSDDDEVDGTEAYLGPESVGLDELERAWGGRRGGQRASPFAMTDASADGGPVAVKVEDGDGDARMASDEVRLAKQAFAQALVEKSRAATAVKMGCEDDSDEDRNEPGDGMASCRPVGTRLKKKRRDSLLPKPLLAPVRHDIPHRRSTTAAVIADFDDMDLLFTPESGLGRPTDHDAATEAVATSTPSKPAHLHPSSEAPSSGPPSVAKERARVLSPSKRPAAAARESQGKSSLPYSDASSPMTDVDDLDISPALSVPISIPSPATKTARTTRRTSRVGDSK